MDRPSTDAGATLAEAKGHIGGSGPTAPRRSLASRLLGYDIFLSFALGPCPRGTHSYASDLARRLQERDFTVFFSEQEMPPGEQLESSLEYALFRSKVLVVIANRGTLEEPRWVRREVEAFRQRHPGRPVIPINVGGALADPALAPAAQEWLDCQGRVWLDESAEAVATGIATEQVVDRLVTAPRQFRTNLWWRWIKSGAASLLTILSLGLAWSAKVAVDNARLAEQRLALANQQTARANDENKEAQRQRGLAQEQTDRAIAARDAEQRQRKLADDREREATIQRERAQHQLLAANLNLARVFEEKADAELTFALRERQAAAFQAAWLYSLAALRLEIEPGRTLPVSLGRLLMPGLREMAFAERWRTPERRGDITAIAFSPDDRLLALGVGESVSIWDTQRGERVRVLEGQYRSVGAVAFSASARLLVSASVEGSVSIWSIADGTRVTVIPEARVSPSRVAFTDDDRLLAVGFHDGTVQRWDLSTPTPRILESRKTVDEDVLRGSFTADFRTVALADSNGTIRLQDTTTRKTLGSFRHTIAVPSLAVSEGGEMLAAGAGNQVDQERADATVRLWNLASGGDPVVLIGHKQSVTALAFSPDVRILASGSRDGTVRVWNTRGRQLLAVFNSANGLVSELSFSRDGRTLAVGSVGPWDEFRPGGGSVQLFDVSEARLVGALTQSREAFTAVAYSPDGKELYAGLEGGSIEVWNTAAGTRVAELRGHSAAVTALACAVDGTALISGSGSSLGLDRYKQDEEHTMRMWRIPAAKEVLKIESRRAVTGVAISRDNSLAWVSADGSVRVNDRWIKPPTDDAEPVLSVAFSPDGRMLATGSGSVASEEMVWDGFRLWEVSTGRELLRQRVPRPVLTVAFSPDGKTLATGSGNPLLDWPPLQEALCFWDVLDGRKKGCLAGAEAVIYDIVYSPRGDILVSGARDGTVRFWDPMRLRELARLPLHTKAVLSVAFSPDGQTVVSAGADGVIRLTDASSLTSLFTDGKPTASVASIFEASRFLLPFNLEGLTLEPKMARSLVTGRGSIRDEDLATLLAPRPLNSDLVQWMLRKPRRSR